jgi:hypothetical protein
MTTNREFVDELKASLGNNTMITDDRYVRWLNFALLDLCGMHRKRAFPPKRFRVLEGRLLLASDVMQYADLPVEVFTAGLSGTGVMGTVDSIVSSSLSSTEDNYYVDWIVEVTGYVGTAPEGLIGQQRLCVGSVALTTEVLVSPQFTVAPDTNTEISLYRRSYNLEGVTTQQQPSTRTSVNQTGGLRLWAIERIENAEDGTPLTPKDWRELAGQSFYTKGSPSTFARRDTEILFDAAPDTDITWRVWFYRYPLQFDVTTLDTVVCELPDDWHELVLMGAIWRGWKALMEPQRADSAYQQYINEATNRIDTHMLEEKHVLKQFKVKR